MADAGNLRQAVPFFKVADIERSLTFYRDGLGFRLQRKWEPEGRLRWCWLERGEVALMLQQFPAEGHDSWRPSGEVGEGVSICIMCDDARELYRELRSKAVDASQPFVGNGLWVTSVTDPDGFRLDFESPAEEPEDTQYSGA
ncbi:MAG: VOC family protein [Sphingomonadaceae bacterium]|nr:VOC family protein [Sphingomonadaceae bacterium]